MNQGITEKAAEFARICHRGNVRKFTGEPYIKHPGRVVALLQTLETPTDQMNAAAWLHDVVEDCGISVDAIEEAFGGVVATLVIELTKPNEPRTISAMQIKACDLIDNLGSIAQVAPRDQAIAYLAKKAPQVLRISETLRKNYPALAETLAQAWWRNWESANA